MTVEWVCRMLPLKSKRRVSAALAWIPPISVHRAMVKACKCAVFLTVGWLALAFQESLKGLKKLRVCEARSFCKK